MPPSVAATAEPKKDGYHPPPPPLRRPLLFPLCLLTQPPLPQPQRAQAKKKYYGITPSPPPPSKEFPLQKSKPIAMETYIVEGHQSLRWRTRRARHTPAVPMDTGLMRKFAQSKRKISSTGEGGVGVGEAQKVASMKGGHEHEGKQERGGRGEDACSARTTQYE